jgi:two-component system phosphate regulon sensor histidine kinase PhoR
MLRSRFLWKLYAGYVAVILLTTAIVGIVVARWIVQDSMQETQRALQTRAILLRDVAPSMFKAAADARLQKRLRLLGVATGTRFTVIRLDGTVVADSEEEPARMDNHADRPEIVAARSDGVGTTTRFSHTLGTRMMYVALPVRQHEQLLGYVRTALPLTAIDQRLAYLRAIVILGAGIAAAVGLFLGFFFARHVTRPLISMTATAASMAGENYDQQVRTRSRDEIGALADAFNRMAFRLRERMETLAREHNQLLAVLGSMVEGVIAVDHDERVVHMNQAAGVMLHTSPTASIGRRIWEVTRVRAVVKALADTTSEANAITREALIVEQSRDQVVEMHAAPLRDRKGELSGAVVVLHDITALRRLERVRREFVANVSHELKTPVTAITGFIETLRDGALDDREQAERFLEIVARHADRLHAIIEDLLSLSRLEQDAETWELPHTEETLAEVLQAAVQDCTAKAVAKQVTITSSCDPTLRVRINAPLVQQALVNLLDNAINYSQTDSPVWLEATHEGNDVAIRVRDQGSGIPQEHLPRLFERFYRADKARSREHGGTGLGLAIVKHIALVHGGRVSVTSAVGQGSTFTLHLPATSEWSRGV